MRPSLRDSARFVRDLATLLRMAYDLPEAVARIQAGSTGTLKAALEPVRQQLLGGATLGQAIGAARLFPDVVRRGLDGIERQGDPVAALERLADLIELAESRRVSMSAALAYPRLLLTVGVVMLWCVAGPTSHALVRGTFSSARWLYWSWSPMPPLTRFICSVSDFLVSGDGIALAVLVLAGIHMALAGSFGLSRGWPMVPGVGSWMRRQDTVTWCLWMDHLLSAAVPLPEAVRVAAESCVSEVFVERMERAATRTAQGASILDALAREQALPPVAGWLLAQAESQEFRPGTLTKVARCLERSMVTTSNEFLGVVEPLALAVVGVLVAVSLVTLFVPQYALIGQLH